MTVAPLRLLEAVGRRRGRWRRERRPAPPASAATARRVDIHGGFRPSAKSPPARGPGATTRTSSILTCQPAPTSTNAPKSGPSASGSAATFILRSRDDYWQQELRSSRCPRRHRGSRRSRRADVRPAAAEARRRPTRGTDIVGDARQLARTAAPRSTRPPRRTAGTPSSISVNLDGASDASALEVGLYSDDDGQPTTLLTSGAHEHPGRRLEQVTVPAARLEAGKATGSRS